MKVYYQPGQHLLFGIVMLALRLIVWGLVTVYWFIPAIIADTSNAWIIFWYFIYNILILTLKLDFKDKYKCSRCHRIL